MYNVMYVDYGVTKDNVIIIIVVQVFICLSVCLCVRGRQLDLNTWSWLSKQRGSLDTTVTLSLRAFNLPLSIDRMDPPVHPKSESKIELYLFWLAGTDQGKIDSIILDGRGQMCSQLLSKARLFQL